ncbi:MAG TPA: hypothetical protein VLA66_02935, partial [Thermoanaerobaculia bacterium]|nr:hypothetical protein [Thermoanaerobaculia bacterium]
MRGAARLACAGRAAVAGLLLAAAGSTARGQDLAADEAVRRALTSSPTVALAAEQVAAQEAALQRAEGLFDGLVGFDGSIDYGLEELVGRRLRAEVDRRLRLEIPPPVLDETAQKLIDGVPTDGSLLFPSSCQRATSFILLGGGGTIICVDDDGNLLGLVSSEFAIDPSVFGAVSLAQAFVGLSGLDERVQVFVDLLRSAAADQLRLAALILRRTADSLRFQRIRLGDVPTDRESIRMDLGLDHQHRFRNGSALVSSLSLASTEENFRGKPHNPTLGDSTLPNVFRVGAGIALDLPLGRGGGRKSFEAPLKAS